MAVAVKNTPETSATKLTDHLAPGSLAGVLYVLGSLWVVFYGLPSLWWNLAGVVVGFTGEFVPAGASAVRAALLLVLMAGAGVGLFILGVRLLEAHAKPGLRAGIFFGLFGVLVAAELASAAGTFCEYRELAASVGMGISGAVAVLGLAGLAYLYIHPRCEHWLTAIEEQGWFSSASYKRNQGMRVRRGTMLGVLVTAGCGIYTLLSHRTLQTGPATWTIAIPYSEGRYIPLLPHVSITLPLVLAAGSLWLAYRVVNYPTFADFLIATEAEINKVSWTTRKRLFQDTVVVLATVVLLTVFLFVVDQVWAQVLTRVGVLQITPDSMQQAAPKEPTY